MTSPSGNGLPRIPLSTLYDFCQDVLAAVGMSAESAHWVAQSLIEADARALSSHGVVRLLPVYVRRLEKGTTNPAPAMEIASRRSNLAVIDGDRGPGQVVGQRAMELAIEMAREGGIGAVGVRRSSHFGVGALYVEQAARAGMVGLALTNAPSNMPPAGGRSRYFGTNPLAIGAPGAGEQPIVLDMSTSVVARGRIVMAQKEGKMIPPGWAIDAEGNPTEDPAAALLGAVLPMAGYKGAGLALMIDLLCGVLTGAAFGGHIVDLYDQGDEGQNVGHLFIAIDVEAFMPVEAFRARIAQFVDEVRAQPRQPGVERIYLPGEIEFAAAARAAETGVAIPAAGWQELAELAARLGVVPLDRRLMAGSASM